MGEHVSRVSKLLSQLCPDIESECFFFSDAVSKRLGEI